MKVRKKKSYSHEIENSNYKMKVKIVGYGDDILGNCCCGG